MRTSKGRNHHAISGQIKKLNYVYPYFLGSTWGWSGGAMALGKLPVPGRPTILITVGQGPIALAVGAGGGGLDIFTLIYPFSSASPSLWETARYRLKYCLKGPLHQNNQPTNQLGSTYSSSYIDLIKDLMCCRRKCCG